MSIKAKDIADKLGVSVATVSLVLNNRPGISEKTREKVLEEIEASGYKKKIKETEKPYTNNLRIVIYKDHGLVVADTPFFSQLIESIEGNAREQGYNTLISYLSRHSNIKTYLKRIENDGNTSGIIVLATEAEEKDIMAFRHTKLPLLILDNCSNVLDIDSVQIDNIGGVIKAINYLVECGHKEIGYLHSSVDIYNFAQRKLGYREALRDQKLDYKSSNIFELEPTIEGSYRDMKKHIESGAELPEALFADNDIIAMGASRALKEQGYKLPNEISIVGFDDVSYCIVMRPELTTIRVNTTSMGSIAVKRMVDIITTKTEETINVLVRTEIIVRNSVKEI